MEKERALVSCQGQGAFGIFWRMLEMITVSEFSKSRKKTQNQVTYSVCPLILPYWCMLPSDPVSRGSETKDKLLFWDYAGEI